MYRFLMYLKNVFFIFIAYFFNVTGYSSGLPEMPLSISSMEDLNNYALHYWQANEMLSDYHTKSELREIKSHEIPCSRFYILSNSDSSEQRVARIFKKAWAMREQENDMRFSLHQFQESKIYVWLAPFELWQNETITSKFENFLLRNNQDFIANYREVLSYIHKHTKVILQRYFVMVNFIRNSPLEVIKDWAGVAHFTDDQKEYLLSNLEGAQNDLNRREIGARYLLERPHAQLLELYLFAEFCFDSVESSKRILMKYIEYNKKNPDSANFFHHPEFYYRNIYLDSLAIAHSLFDFANNFRRKAGLDLLSETLLEPDPNIEQMIVVDSNLKSMKEAEALWQKRQEKQWSSRINKVVSKQSALGSKNTSHQRGIEQLRSAPMTEALIAPAPPSYAEALRQGSSSRMNIGNQIVNLLSPKVVHSWQRLLSMQPLTKTELRELYFEVYEKLIISNHGKNAAFFLKYVVDPRIFPKGEKGHEKEPLAQVEQERAILPFLIAHVIHPNFTMAEILSGAPHLKNIWESRKISHGKIDLNQSSYTDMKALLEKSESLIEAGSERERRAHLIGLSHSWHKLRKGIESGSIHCDGKRREIASIIDTIKRLLEQAWALLSQNDAADPSVLEAYLFNFYLSRQIPLPYQKLSQAEINQIKRSAHQALAFPRAPRDYVIDEIDLTGKKVGSYTLSDSIYHEITNNQIAPYVIVRLKHHVPESKLPLFIRYNGDLYRTDVFGGSRLKTQSSRGNYGSLIAINLNAADFFNHWFTSEESFWYGQRAFMPETANEKTKSMQGQIVVQTFTDDNPLIIKFPFITQDGFGYIKASKARALGLANNIRTSQTDVARNIAYQALQGYDAQGNKDVARELFLAAHKHLNTNTFEQLSDSECANVLMCTVPKKIGVGIPIIGSNVVLPKVPAFKDLRAGLIVGRNPYSAMRLRHVDKSKIEVSQFLADLTVFQYTLTGYLPDLSGVFFKGMLAVIDDNDWPEHIAADIVVSSKDQKLNTTWLDEQAKNLSVSQSQFLELSGKLIVKQEFTKTFPVGLSKDVADYLTGDFDGDEYDLVASGGFPCLTNLIQKHENSLLMNPKIKKSFTPRIHDGNFSKILSLRRPVLETWMTIMNVFYYLTPNERFEFARTMARDHMLDAWLGEDWQKQLGVGADDYISIVTREIQLGVKFGEDAYKTKIDTEIVMSRARAYQTKLLHYVDDLSVPYGNRLKKELMNSAPKAALNNLYSESAKSSNIVHKAFRGLARYFRGEKCGLDYVSDDEE